MTFVANHYSLWRGDGVPLQIETSPVDDITHLVAARARWEMRI